MSAAAALLDTASFWMRLAAGLGAGAAVWLAALGFGGLAKNAVRWPELRRAEGIVLAGALGYGLLGSAVALLGAFRAIGNVSLTLLLAIGIASAAFFVRGERSASSAVAPRQTPPVDRFAWFVTCCAWLTACAAAALPAVDWDPLAYHLPIIVAALRSGSLAVDPGLAQSAFPLLAESASVPAFWLAGSAGASFAVMGSGIILSLLCGAAAERVRTGSGALACALMSSSAVWLWLAPAPYVDVPFAMFAVAAIVIAMCAPHVGPRAALAAGLFAGASAAVKYTGLIDVGVVAFVLAIRANSSVRIKVIAASLATAVVACGGWYLRAWSNTGDPIFPFASEHLGATQGVRDFATRYVTMTRDWCGGPATLGDFFLLPWRLLSQPQAFCGDPGYALRLASILVLAGLFVAASRPFAVVTVALTTIWFWTSRQWRFLIPAVATYAIAAATGLDALARRQRVPIQALLLCIALLGISLDWLPRAGVDASNSIAPAYAYLAGAQTGEAYLSARLEIYAADRWALAHLPAGGRVASLDEVRNYYLNGAAFDLNPYYQQQFAVDWSAPPARRYDAALASGARLMIVNANPVYVQRTPVGVDWSALAADVRAGVLRRAFSANDVTVYVLPRAASRLQP